jgi:hypothetical protein
MSEITLETLHHEIIMLRQDMIRLEAKIDSKPSLAAMFTGIFIVVFDIVIASTIVTLSVLGFHP